MEVLRRVRRLRAWWAKRVVERRVALGVLVKGKRWLGCSCFGGRKEISEGSSLGMRRSGWEEGKEMGRVSVPFFWSDQSVILVTEGRGESSIVTIWGSSELAEETEMACIEVGW